jgi:hypothetical protein
MIVPKARDYSWRNAWIGSIAGACQAGIGALPGPAIATGGPTPAELASR